MYYDEDHVGPHVSSGDVAWSGDLVPWEGDGGGLGWVPRILTKFFWDEICPFRSGPIVGPIRSFEWKLRAIDIWSYTDILGTLHLC
jgi:hypothetical protein